MKVNFGTHFRNSIRRPSRPCREKLENQVFLVSLQYSPTQQILQGKKKLRVDFWNPFRFPGASLGLLWASLWPPWDLGPPWGLPGASLGLPWGVPGASLGLGPPWGPLGCFERARF